MKMAKSIKVHYEYDGWDLIGITEVFEPSVEVTGNIHEE